MNIAVVLNIHQHLVLLNFILLHLLAVEKYLTVVFFFFLAFSHFTDEVVYLFMFSECCVIPFMKHLWSILLIYTSSLYILETNSLLMMCFINIYTQI